MTTAVRARARFFEGGNLATVIAVPIVFVGTMFFYGRLVKLIKPLNIEINDVYSYVFNLYAIELGAVLAIFALFACRPTPFLERIKSTSTFAAIVANTNITLLMIVATVATTFVLGILKFPPHGTLDFNSIVFLAWACLTLATTCICIRTVRLLLTALA